MVAVFPLQDGTLPATEEELEEVELDELELLLELLVELELELLLEELELEELEEVLMNVHV